MNFASYAVVLHGLPYDHSYCKAMVQRLALSHSAIDLIPIESYLS